MSAPAARMPVGASRQAALRRLELRVTRRLDGLLHGDYRGLVLAAGTELGEAREYRVGDDVRRIDWNLTARTTAAHVRDTVAERELETWLVVDRSASMNFGTVRCEKRDLATEVAAAFALLNDRAGNRTGAIVAAGGRPAVIPPRSGRDGVLALLHLLVGTATAAADGSGGGGLADACAVADRTARRRGLVVVVSDFLDGSPWPVALRRLAGRHQLIGVEVRDPREDELPPVGLLTLVDPETGARLEVQSDSRRLRARFAAAAAGRRQEIAAQLRGSGARHLVVSTGRDWLLDLARAVDQWRGQP